MRISNIVFLINFLLFTDALARPHVASVVKVRGKATKLTPGALKASRVKVGDRLYEDTSLVTGSRSYVKIEFLDKSHVSIGSKSKLVVTEVKTSSGSVLSLLKGKIRASVKKDSDKDAKKFFIKTRTAALGVRGTDFQTIYNPENNVTNLLTYEGEVAIAKIDNSIEVAPKKELVLTRTDENKVKYKEVESETLASDGAKINSLLERSVDTVGVKQGQFAATSLALNKASKPVKINPVQLGLLYENTEFQTGQEAGEKLVKDVSSIKDYPKIKQADQDASLEGFSNKVTGDYAPKSGGLIDLETGLYLAPGKDAYFDEVKQVYVPKRIGRLDSATGEYIAPKGMKLDANRGFVLRGYYKDPKKQELLVQNQKVLNDSLKKTSLAKEINIDDSNLIYSRRELFAKDILNLTLSPTSKDLDVTNVSSNERRDIFLSTTPKLSFLWMMAGNGTYRPTVSFSMDSTNYEDEDRFEKEGEKLYGISFGLERYLSTRWSLISKVSIDETNIPSSYDNFSNTTLEKVSLTKFYLGARGQVVKYKKSYLALGALAFTSFYKKDSPISVKNSFGFETKLTLGYWLNRSNLFEASLINDFHALEVKTETDAYEIDYAKSGLELSYSYIF